mmetsp:Transcript_10297/g.26577  ORF Transcript_10297/g.26577 Transcript_10297/m.26577 type:complete len:92 (-) Transcript_10297:458-733(-)
MELGLGCRTGPFFLRTARYAMYAMYAACAAVSGKSIVPRKGECRVTRHRLREASRRCPALGQFCSSPQVSAIQSWAAAGRFLSHAAGGVCA